VWDDVGVIGEKGTALVNAATAMPMPSSSPDGRLSVVENLLDGRGAADDAPAIEYRREDGLHRTLTWAELRAETAAFAAALAAMGVSAR
jgi:acetoacetyl-CoA synthetase